MHDSSDVETHSLRSEGRMFVAIACLSRKKAMKRKTKEEYSEAETLTACSFKAAAEMLTNSSCSSPSFALSMNSTGDYKTLFYQGLAISNPNKSKED